MDNYNHLYRTSDVNLYDFCDALAVCISIGSQLSITLDMFFYVKGLHSGRIIQIMLHLIINWIFSTETTNSKIFSTISAVNQTVHWKFTLNIGRIITCTYLWKINPFLMRKTICLCKTFFCWIIINLPQFQNLNLEIETSDHLYNHQYISIFINPFQVNYLNQSPIKNVCSLNTNTCFR